MKTFSKEQIAELIAVMAGPQATGYGLRPIPCELDRTIEGIVDTYAQSVPEERQAIAALFDSRHAFTLMAYAERMAILAVRQHSLDAVRRGITALAIEGFKLDPRENILRLALLHHSASKLNEDAKLVFDSVADLAEANAAQEIRQFALRPASDQRIETMGYGEDQSLDGFTYSRRW